MTQPLSVVAISGSLHSPSKSTALITAVTAALASRIEIDVHLIEVSELASQLGTALSRTGLPAALEVEFAWIESADLLVVASPVYRATYTGLFKHLFDLVGQDALVGTPVLLAATGGNDRHSLVIDHQLRPLFAFFRANSLPVGVYARDADFRDGAAGEELVAAIDVALDAGLPLLARR